MPRARSMAHHQRWSWGDLPVDAAQDHFELRYGLAAEEDEPRVSLLVARVGPPVKQAFAVEWLVDPADSRHRDAIAAVRKELDYYLVAKGEVNPWLYARHHSGTAANVYSAVHWSFHPQAAVAADAPSTMDGLTRLDEIGFHRVGRWNLVSGEPAFALDADASTRGALYAFVSGRAVLYLGKTSQPLHRRMHGYQRPGATQRTNIAGHTNISQLLASRRPLDIYALRDSGTLRHGAFEVSLSAGLEDALIRELQPPWNMINK